MIPKFRAWDKVARKMSQITAIDFSTKPFRVFYKAYGNENYFNQDAILMQSTGLKDKNGVEIFEGDIVVTASDKVYIIIRSKTGLYKAVEKNKDEIYYITLDVVCDLLEVIGNIYENSELLED